MYSDETPGRRAARHKFEGARAAIVVETLYAELQGLPREIGRVGHKGLPSGPQADAQVSMEGRTHRAKDAVKPDCANTERT
jgi:hypothetical protein